MEISISQCSSLTSLVSTFAHETRKIAHETSFLLLLTKRVFCLCSRNECSRNEFLSIPHETRVLTKRVQTREQFSFKEFNARLIFQFCTCAPRLNIVNMTNTHCITNMITWFFVLKFLDYVDGDARLRRPLSLELSLDPERKIRVVEYVHRQSFC